ncbi:MAG: tetratricopeptide repeat protein [Gemmatimonadota bacterium]
MTSEASVPSSRPAASGTWWPGVLALVVLTVGAGVTGLSNGFTYDDIPIIATNPRVHTLEAPWVIFAQRYWPAGHPALLYRPLGILLFALEWQAGGGRPFLYHVVNLLLAAAVTVAVYALARRLLPRWPAWAAAALFAVHPVHVEVTANVVGQLELIVALLLCLGVAMYLRWRGVGNDDGSGLAGPIPERRIAGLAAVYAAACLVKDNAIVLPALLLLAEWLLVRDDRPPAARIRSLLPAYAALATVGMLYLAVRTIVTGKLGGDIALRWLLEASFRGRVCTMLAIVPEWARLLLWPERLGALYGPPGLPVLESMSAKSWLGLALVAGVALAFVAALRRDRRVSFALAWLGITLLPVSNILVISGVFLGERTLFLPSVGFVLLIGVAVEWLLDRAGAFRPARVALVTALAALVLLGAGRSLERHPVWRDNATLFAQSVLDTPESYTAWWNHGSALFAAGKPGSGEAAMRRAMALYDRNPFLFEELADQYFKAGLCPQALPLYRRTIELEPGHWWTRLKAIDCLVATGDSAGARREAEAGLAVGRHADEFRRALALLNGATPDAR